MAKVQCLTCGGMAELDGAAEGICPYCGCTVTLRRMSSLSRMSTVELLNVRTVLEKPDVQTEQNKNLPLGLCYLKTGNFELAKKKLAQVMEESPECAESYFYYSVALLHGKRLSSITMSEARQVCGYLKTAMALDENFPFPKLLYGLLCLEYYRANDLIPPDDGGRLLREVAELEIDEQEYLFFKQMIPTNTI